MTTKEELFDLALLFGARLRTAGIPFICIIGVPAGIAGGEESKTMRMSNQLNDPAVNMTMGLEVDRYLEFHRTGGASRN